MSSGRITSRLDEADGSDAESSGKRSAITVRDFEGAVGLHAQSVAIQSKLRAAVFSGVKEGDIQAIIAKQVEKAKAGDASAAQFVMRCVVGMGQPVTLQNFNVYGGVEEAARVARRKSKGR